MKSHFPFPRIKIKLNGRTTLSLLVAECIVLSIFHHWVNFWGLPWDKQALLILVIAPAFSLLISFLLAPIWVDCKQIRISRWLVFLLPALGIASIVTWRLFLVPEIQHQLEIIPVLSGSTNEIQLLEIKAAYGNVVPLSNFSSLKGWTLHNGVLIANGPAYQPIRYSFYGPINQQVRTTFGTSAKSGNVEVVLDGRKLDLGLKSSDGNQKRARMDTQYRWGFLNFLIIPIIVATDLFTVIFILTLVWLIQEINQNRTVESGEHGLEAFPSHLTGLLILCSLALALHVINFLAVPLAVLKDSPSYLQGAVYWLRYHSLDGVSSYRGPGTTFLFAPFMALFGRNPFGVKILLHLLAIACVPVSYRLGWQLGRRRWFAFLAGLITALIPDLYFYSNFVLSEVPHFFFGLLFCTLLLSALETMTVGWLIAALLVGSFSVLVRSESATALLIGIAFLIFKVIWDWKNQKTAGVLPAGFRWKSSLWRLGLAILVAAIPLLGWSAHNERVYGFWGISDYEGEILYDGWIYFGLNSNIPITDQNSSAVKAIDAVYQPGLSNTSDVPSGWTIYYLLLQHGYSSEQAFSILGQASTDSIRKDIPLSLKLLIIKIQKGLEPQVFFPATFQLPGEKPDFMILNSDYFDKEPLFFPALIDLQRFVYGVVSRWYQNFYTVWFWLCLGLSFICFYRKPFFQWVPLVVIAVSSVFLPTVMGMSMWRYVLSGIFLMQLFVLAGVQSVGEFLPYYLTASRRKGEKNFRQDSPSGSV
jgi:4-amino-4-deoxy-L-arabinose transferase-like glycosyltransferase